MRVLDINSLESWKILEENENSLLIDVRTTSEFRFNGIADLSTINKNTILIPWKDYPTLQVDPQFNEKLQKVLQEKFPEKDNAEVQLLFICAGGIRSLEAARSMAQIGYQCYNIKDGFEGQIDQYNRKNGWKNHLPWKQN